jgi:homogentisate 1,2-dioxygenase
MSRYTSSFTIGEAEAYRSGLLDAADACDRELFGKAASMLRMMATINRASETHLEPVLKPAEPVSWVERYIAGVKARKDGRAAYKARTVLANFSNEDDFIKASDKDVLLLPNCGEVILKLLREVQHDV